LRDFLNEANKFNFPVHTPYEDLSEEEQDLLWEGNEYFNGIYHFFNKIEEKSYKIQNRVLLARYRGRTKCPECKGSRLRKEALYVKVADTPINKLIFLPIDELHDYFKNIELDEQEYAIAKRLLVELNTRLSTMVKIGLGYLTLERLSSSLSGGEIQRIHLTRTLSSNLTHSMYILDEPSIGLHPKDSDQLVNVLYELRDLGNTVIVVEHEEEIIRKADGIIELGPDAGIHGGEIVYSGSYEDFLDEAKNSYTADYLTGEREIPLPDVRRKPKRFLNIKCAKEHNLQRIDVDIPLHALSVVTGVSGSGKSTLVQDILYPALLQKINDEYGKKPGSHKGLEGALDGIDKVEMIDQNPIGRSSRSNPVTYIKAYDGIRNLMASQQLSKIRGYKAKHFSFNVEGGRCENCQGEGETTVEMQFLADVKLECEECRGRRFKDEVLEVEYNGKNIFDILEMSVEEAIDFFEDEATIQKKLQPLQDVGLGYIKLGQASSTLSGGEAQRVKLAFYLSKEGSTDRMLFIFDEPTTGLHFHDIHKLLSAVNALIERGHTVIIVEHNMDVIKCADWIVDLGPEGGKNGGKLLYQGPLEGILEKEESHTARYLKEKI
jgi:excinuclease ABC subunit A